MDNINPKYIFVPVEKATVPPPGLIEHLKDRWWLVHPERGLAFFDERAMSPQCNSNETIARHLARNHPWAEVQFFPSVFRRINPKDYVG